MSEQRLLNILQAPYVSEKAAMSNNGYRQYVFRVAPDATKFEIRAAVEQLFNVTVRSVRVCNTKGKPARFGRRLGRRKGWKKAYVQLNQDQDIDLASGQA